MDFDTKRRVLTGISGILLFAIGFAAAARQAERPLWYASDIQKTPAMAVAAVPGMGQRKVLVNRNGATLWLKINSEPDCDYGDLDYMNNDLKRLQVPSLILTAENLFSGERVPPVHRLNVTLDQVRGGQEINFTFPYSEKPVHYGIYLCSDSGTTGGCHGKPLANYEAAQNGISPSDKVYFFAYVMLVRDTVHVLDNSVFPAQRQALFSYLQKVQEVSPLEAQMVVNVVNAFNTPSKLRWSKAVVDGSTIKLSLTHFGHPEKCDSATREYITAKIGTGKVMCSKGTSNWREITRKPQENSELGILESVTDENQVDIGPLLRKYESYRNDPSLEAVDTRL